MVADLKAIYNFGKATLKFLDDLAITILRNDGYAPQLAIAGEYRIMQHNKTIWEGTEDAIKQFSKKIDDIANNRKLTQKEAKAQIQEFVDEIKVVKNIKLHYDDIVNFRKLKKIPKYILEDGASGTVAKIEINGKNFFGINSSFVPESISLRKKWFDKISWVPPKKSVPKHLGYTQSLTHAEAHSLIEAFEEMGSLPKKVIMYVDRPTCNICKGELPIIMKAMGIEELAIFSGNKIEPLLLKLN
ncbi:MAG: deaminase [Chitinophagales bacterium]|nr:hypothetical protein [Chitinophagales bacterium]